MAEAKLSLADQEHLVTIILDAICERKSRRQINKIADAFLETINITLHANSIRKYYELAKAEFNAPYKAQRDKLRINAIYRLDALYKRCVDSGDLSTALKIEKELTLLRGVYKDLDADDKEQTINIVFKDAKKE